MIKDFSWYKFLSSVFKKTDQTEDDWDNIKRVVNYELTTEQIVMALEANQRLADILDEALFMRSRTKGMES